MASRVIFEIVRIVFAMVIYRADREGRHSFPECRLVSVARDRVELMTSQHGIPPGRIRWSVLPARTGFDILHYTALRARQDGLQP
jgi:hypothetical protein